MTEFFQESNLIFMEAFKQASDGMILLNFETNIFEEVNNAICQMLGYSPEELTKLSIKDIHPEKDLPFVLEEFNKQINKEITLAKNLPVKRKDGSVFYADVNSCIFKVHNKPYVLGIFRDIKDRSQLEKKYNAIVENSTDQIFMVDKEYKLAAANKIVLWLFQKSYNEVIGKHISEIFPKEIVQKNLQYIEKVFQAKESVVYEEKINIGKDEIWLNVKIDLVKNSNGEIEYVIGFARDITKQKEIEKNLECKNKELKELTRKLSNLLRFKLEFLTNITHELMTPLNSIIGFSEILNARYFGPLNEKQLEYVKNIFESGTQLFMMIDMILDLTSIEKEEPELHLSVFVLEPFLKKIINAVNGMVKSKYIAVNVEISENTGRIKADEQKLKKVLLNLFNNAIEFTPEYGSIGLKAKRIGHNLELEVWDTGIGLEGNLEEAFKNLTLDDESQLHEKSAVKGLGLTVCRKLVELHGGRIWLESGGIGKGTVAKLIIPC